MECSCGRIAEYTLDGSNICSHCLGMLVRVPSNFKNPRVIKLKEHKNKIIGSFMEVRFDEK